MSTTCRRLEKKRILYVPGVVFAMAATFWTNSAEAQIMLTGRCCLPNGGGCIVTTQVTCDNYCGSFGGAGTNCSGPVICLAQNPPPPPPPPILGACCLANGSCTLISECNCDGQGGVYQGNNTTCGGSTCDPNNGACCLPDGSCISTDDCDCDHQCGVFSGPGTICGICPISVTGKCCLPDGTCTQLSECECDNACGIFSGVGTICTGGLCITPLPGACCAPDGTCSVLSRCECDAICGTHNGIGTKCSGVVLCLLPEPGACCLPDGESCTIVDTVCDCDDLCGDYQGDGSRCSACPTCATPDLGCWSDPVDLNDGSNPSWTHAAQLINGKALLISANNPTRCHLFDPSDDSFSVQFSVTTGHRLFCSGHTYTDNGRIVFYGGTGIYRQLTTIYTPDSGLGTWAAGATGPAKRFYPTLTTLSDGSSVLVTDGADNDGPPTTNPRIPDIYDPNADTWTRLTGAEYNNGTYPFDLPNYPSMYLATNGFVIYTGSANGAGPNPLSQTSKFLDPLLERWIEGFTPPDPIEGGSHISYGLNHFMKAGGRQLQGTPTNLVYDLVDPTGSSPQWVQLGSMNNTRREFLLVGLPGAEGSILAVGGEAADGSSVKKPELYSAGANTWTELKEATHPREYHASALLLPDARVLSAGGQGNGTGKTTVEIFSPPYLYESTGRLASRPTISSVTGPGGSDILNFNNTFVATTTSAGSVTEITLISPGVVTHALDHHQMVRSLDFVLVDSNTLKVRAPVHEYEAPPGYYMLFITADGVPSKAVWVQLERL